MQPSAVELMVESKAAVVYERAIRTLEASGIPFLLGGAAALARYAGIVRRTKDLDVFVRPDDVTGVLAALAAAGFRTEIASPVWLGKAWWGEYFVDVIFSSGNGIATVDDEWLRHAHTGHVLGVPVAFCPAEETIWSKAWIMERERFDGADVAHIVRGWGERMDWNRLVRRFGLHWRVLLSHLVLYGFIYPAERARVPDWVMRDLLDRLARETGARAPDERVCQGTLLSGTQYGDDVELWGYLDPRARSRPVLEVVGAEGD